MVQASDSAKDTPKKGRLRRWPRKFFYLLLLLFVIAMGIAWFQREDIAQTLITDYFEDQNVPATYTIEKIAAQEQVLTDIVIGDPARPDLTIERLELSLTARLGLPAITRLRVTRPRLYGSIADGQLSFGSLDPLIFTGGDEPFEFPDIELTVVDGRGRIASDAGAIGLKLTGNGHLRGGFTGELAALAPALQLEGCQIQRTSLYGEISIDAERPRFAGPLRFDSMGCDSLGLSVQGTGANVALRFDRNLEDFEGEAQLSAHALTLAGNQIGSIGGEGAFSWRDAALRARYDVHGNNVNTQFAAANRLSLAGDLRADSGFANVSMDGEITGDAITPGPTITSGLVSAQSSAAGTLLEPLLAKFVTSLLAETRSSTLSASFTARRDESEAMALVLPEARWTGTSGASLLSLSRMRFSFGAEDLPQFDGNFATGGANLPRITGRMEQEGGGALALLLAMQNYRAGDAQLAIPRMTITPEAGNRFAIEGIAMASGAIPGGAIAGLTLPLDGTVSRTGAIAMWDGCRRVSFDRLSLADFTLDGQTLALCPAGEGAILRSGADGLRLDAVTQRLDLAARYGDSPLSIRSGPLALSYPGSITVPDLAIALGTGADATRLSASNVTADLASETLQGRFAGTQIVLPAIPLDIAQASGAWRFADGVLQIDEGAFTVSDRSQPARFEPLVAQGAAVNFADGVISAEAVLREPFTKAEVVAVDLVHDLSIAVGHANLTVRGLTFTDDLQPFDLTQNARGVVANVDGTVTGTGRIDWNGEEVTSTGAFSSDRIDFAAAFGPVKGASGTVKFTDLIGLTTAPNQRIALAAINPGIEVNDGEVGISIEGGTLVRFEGGRWPLLGGTMIMRPVDINVGAIEERTYLIEIQGLEANLFIERMELNNLSANGVFDGTIPIIFDADGNGRLEAGRLVSRAPGGNLAYVGELTYEDLGTFGNYAFGALRDMRYDRMEIQMDGPLTGELVTKVRFEGIGQGETAQSNFITRQIAKLPIELRINIRAPFYQLISSTRSLYDPSAVRDPRALGLVSDDGTQFLPADPTKDAPNQPRAEDELRNEPEIQPSESEAGL